MKAPGGPGSRTKDEPNGVGGCRQCVPKSRPRRAVCCCSWAPTFQVCLDVSLALPNQAPSCPPAAGGGRGPAAELPHSLTPTPPPAPCGFSCCLQGGLAGSCPRQSSAPAGLARAGGCVSCGLAWENTRPECSRGWKAPGAWPGCLCSRGAARVPQPHSAPPWVESLWQISPGQFGVEARRGVHSPGPATMDRFQGPSPGGSPHLCWC